MHLALILALAAASVEGLVTMEHPLPGCTVTLTNTAGALHTTVTGPDGEYRLEGIEPGNYTLRFTLQGLETSERTIVVGEGVNVLRTEEMKLPPAETIVMGCRWCSWEPAQSVWDLIPCNDEDMDLTLIEAAGQGDRSARDLLIRRHDSASTYEQKHRIAGALLRRVPDDRAYWNELYEHAANAVRFARLPDGKVHPAYGPWCAERGIPEDRYESISWAALGLVAPDPRSRPLLLEALRNTNTDIVRAAIHGLATQGDLTALPAIEQALKAHDAGDASYLAVHLVTYGTEVADQLAYRYLDDANRRAYEEERTMMASGTMRRDE